MLFIKPADLREIVTFRYLAILFSVAFLHRPQITLTAHRSESTVDPASQRDLFRQASGDSMIDGGISDGDLLIVEALLPPAMVILSSLLLTASLREKIATTPDGTAYSYEQCVLPITISSEDTLDVFGVVIHVVRRCADVCPL